MRIYNRRAVGGRGRDAGRSHPRDRDRGAAEDKRSAAQADKIRDYFLEHAAPAPIKAAWTRMIEAKGRRDAFYDSLPTVMVMEEMPTPRETHVLIRGAVRPAGRKGHAGAAGGVGRSSHGLSPESAGTGALAGGSRRIR